MHVLLIPFGTDGDVYPFVWLGRALKARGHKVTLFTEDRYDRHARRAGLDFEPLGIQFATGSDTPNPQLKNAAASFEILAREILPKTLPRWYACIRDCYVPGETVVAACPGAFGARIAHDELGVPLATVHVYPLMLRSIHQPPVMSALPRFHLIPRFLRPVTYRIVDALVDRVIGPPINAFRAELGLPPVRRILKEWYNSPQRVIGLFPDWFAPPQPDWPAQVLLTGFPMYDGAEAISMPPDAEAFLSEGTPPIIFSSGSPLHDVQWFLQASAEACRILGRRGILLTPYRQFLPETLPNGVRHFEFLPFKAALPRAAAIVHHGGIGTGSLALAAGVPQLAIPFGLDQPDNAARFKRLGTLLTIRREEYQAPLLAERLHTLLESPEVAARCKECAERLRHVNPAEPACRAIEELQDQS
ncbi:MAG: glycosyltransferase [Phycisphaerae bacterium]|nr:glycosyltransferase [Phycisphaerae bacterium]